MLDTSTYHHRIKNCNNTLYSLFKLIASKATVNDYIVSSFNSLTTFVGLHGIRHRLITIFRSFHTHFHASGDDLTAGGYHLNASGDVLHAGDTTSMLQVISLKLEDTTSTLQVCYCNFQLRILRVQLHTSTL